MGFIAPIVGILSAAAPVIGAVSSISGLFGGRQPQYQQPQVVQMPPPPPQVIVAPPKTISSLPQSTADKIGANAAAQEQQFDQGAITALQQRAKDQGMDNASVNEAIQSFKDATGQHQSDVQQLLDLSGQVADWQAAKTDFYNNWNFQQQVQAITQYPNIQPQVAYPRGYVPPDPLGAAAKALGGLAGGLGGTTINPNITIQTGGIDSASGQPVNQTPYISPFVDPATGLPYPETQTGQAIYNLPPSGYAPTSDYIYTPPDITNTSYSLPGEENL